MNYIKFTEVFFFRPVFHSWNAYRIQNLPFFVSGTLLRLLAANASWTAGVKLGASGKAMDPIRLI